MLTLTKRTIRPRTGIPVLVLKPSISQHFFPRMYSIGEVSELKEHGFDEPGSKRRKRKATQAYLDKKEQLRARRLKKLRGTPLDLPEYISVKGLAALLHVPSVELVKILIKLGIPPRSADEYLVPDVIDILCHEFDRVPNRKRDDRDIYPAPAPVPGENHPIRPPVVTILGHVNHGKTTLLDTLRQSKKKIVDQEAGGITQHMGAFEIEVDGQTMVFLDTPGHAAFEAMRERGVSLCDVAILVVDVTRGVQDQTISCINFLLKAKIPIVVALNKIDKKGGKPKATKKDLHAGGLHLEEFGGDVPVCEISALKGTGMKELKEMVHLQSSLQILQAPVTGPAEMVIIESRVDIQKGVLGQGIVTRGTLKKGDIFVVGLTHGKIKRIFHDGKIVDTATPGMPIEFAGFESKENLPSPGTILLVVPSEKTARDCITYRDLVNQEKLRSATQLHDQEKKMELQEIEGLERLYASENGLDEEEYIKQKRAEREASQAKDIPILFKGDVAGSIEAVEAQINKFPKDQLNVFLARSGIGPVTEADVKIAASAPTPALILGFNVAVLPKAQALASSLNIKIHSFPIIYSLLEWLTEFLTVHLPPEIQWIEVARAKIKKIFIRRGANQTRIAGCEVTSGIIKRGGDVQILRDGEVFYTGKIRQMRHEKEVVKQMHSGTECGMVFTGTPEFEEGDVVSMVESKSIKSTFHTDAYERVEYDETIE